MEEILDNILEHGYKPDRNNQPIDVRVTVSDGRLIMRVRDYCRRFDLTKEFARIWNDADPTKNIGIRIIEKEAIDVKYVNLVESNTLIITI